MRKPQIENMTLRQKIAQTLVVRQSDLMLRADMDYAQYRESEEAKHIARESQFGGIWIHGNVDVNQIEGSLDTSFTFTTETYRPWLRSVQEQITLPCLCASDVMGNHAFSDMSSVFDGLIVGAADSEELSYQLGNALAKEHALAGGNWLWAPVVDLMSPYTADILRPCAGDPERIIKCSAAYIKGMQAAKVAACVKHFPGADPTERRDPHVVTTKINSSIAEWKKGQGRIFQELIDQGVYTVMTSAGAFPAVDDRKKDGRYLPTSLSYPIVTGLLKNEMGFRGVVITDDVTMGGYTSFYGHDELYVELLKAGNDVLLGVGVDALDLIEKAVKEGKLSKERIDDACQRVLDLKEKLGLFECAEQLSYTAEQARAETEKVLKAIAEKGITLVRDSAGLIPVSKERIKRVTILNYSHYKPMLSQLEVMKREFEKRGAEVILRNKPESFTDIREVGQESDLIVYAAYIGHHKPKGLPSFYDDVFWSLRYAFTAGKEKSIGVSLGYPFIHYDFMEDAPAFVNLYVPAEAAQKAFVSALYGEIPFQGVAPLNMDRQMDYI